MFLLICKLLYICIQNVFGHIFYRSRLHLFLPFWQFEVQKLAYMLILAAGGMIPYLSSVGGGVGPLMANAILNFHFDYRHPSLRRTRRQRNVLTWFEGILIDK